MLDHRHGKEVLAPKLKAFGSTIVGQGDEWVPTSLSSQFIEEFELERRIAAAFREVEMPTNPFEYPVQKTVLEAKLIGEGVAGTDSNFLTDKITLTASKLNQFTVLPEELNEDSAPQILNIARDDVVMAISRAIENAIVNGDNSVTHMDSDTTSASDARKAWKGMRKAALLKAATVAFGSAVTKTKLRDMRTAMGAFGINVAELMWVVSPKGYNQMLNIDEVTTVEKFGNAATILRGSLAAFDGIGIMISEYVRTDVDATGVRSVAGPNTKQNVYLVNTRQFWRGLRRPIRAKVMQDLPNQDRWPPMECRTD